MTNPSISVVVPVYKVEPYLQECIDSILAQSFSDFELILVNDGSPDSCGAICDQNAARDSRIRVYHQKNQGVTRARAKGVSCARGEFITFVDSDDTLPPNALETLKASADSNTDVVIGKYEGAPCPPAGKLSLEDFRKQMAIMQGIIVGPFAKLFRRSLFSTEIFDLPPELKVGEDAVMNIRLAYRASGDIRSVDAVVYVYRDNEESVMHTHKCSPESDMLLQQYRLASIPPEEIPRLLPEGLASSLIHHWINASMGTVRIPDSVREYHSYILSIEKYARLNLSFFPRFILHCNNAALRALVIYARKLARSLLK